MIDVRRVSRMESSEPQDRKFFNNLVHRGRSMPRSIGRPSEPGAAGFSLPDKAQRR